MKAGCRAPGIKRLRATMPFCASSNHRPGGALSRPGKRKANDKTKRAAMIMRDDRLPSAFCNTERAGDGDEAVEDSVLACSSGGLETLRSHTAQARPNEISARIKSSQEHVLI